MGREVEVASSRRTAGCRRDRRSRSPISFTVRGIGRAVAGGGTLAAAAAAFLALTAWTIPATCPPESGVVVGPIRLRAETSCGPAGDVVLRVYPDTCRASLEGGAAVGLPEKGFVHWKRDRSMSLHGEEKLGLAVPEGQFPLTGCTVKLGDLERMAVDCRSWSTKRRGTGPFRELRRCSGTLRRSPAASGP